MMIPVYKPGDDIFLSLVHTALKLRSDVLAQQVYKGVKVSKEAAQACIPDSLYMFLNVLYGGQRVLEGDIDMDDESDLNAGDDWIVSIAQDIIYGARNGKMWTPKHVGLGSMFHQATRSKTLVQLFHKAGHTLSYRDILKIDTAQWYLGVNILPGHYNRSMLSLQLMNNCIQNSWN